MAAAALRIHEVFDEIDRAPAIGDVLRGLPANLADNFTAGFLASEREKVRIWEENARSSVENLINWENPSPGMRDIQRKTIVYLLAIDRKFSLLNEKDIADLSAILNDPNPLVPKEASLELGTGILDLRFHQRKILMELTGKLQSSLRPYLESEIARLQASVDAALITASSRDLSVQPDGDSSLVWIGAFAVLMALSGIILPWLGNNAGYVLAPFGFALWWAAAEGLERNHHGKA